MNENQSIVFSCVLDGHGGIDHSQDEGLAGEAVGLLRSWYHLDYSESGARELLLKSGLPDYVSDAMIRPDSRPSTTAVGDGLMVILRGINRNAGADPEDMVSLRMWVEADRMISVRQRPIKAAQLNHKALEEGHGAESIPDLLIGLISNLADGIALFVDDIEDRMERFEHQIEQGGGSNIRSQISAIRRQLASVRRYLAPQRDSLDSLLRLGGKLFSSEQIYALREQSDRVVRYIEDLDLVRERALVAQEELMNRISQEQNSRTYVLSVVAAIFLPITFISGVFGMNTAGLPGLENPNGFIYVAITMTVICIAIIFWLRAKRWF